MKNPYSREMGFSESKGYWDMLYLCLPSIVVSADLNRRYAHHKRNINSPFDMSYVYDSHYIFYFI